MSVFESLKRYINKTYEISIKPGQIWVMRMSPARLTKDDIIVKVLNVGGSKIQCICKTNYGFTDLTPRSFDILEFLDTFQLLEDVKNDKEDKID